MKKIIIVALFILFNAVCFSQDKNQRTNSIGISVPVVFNNSNGIYYSLGNKREPEGKAISFGIGIDYSRKFYKNFYASLGIGYFKQSFNIERSFEFDGDTATNLLYYTKRYNYNSLRFNVGLGYSLPLNKKINFNGMALFNLFNSFKQSYTPTRYSGYHHKTTQINKKSMQVGYMVNISAGFEYLIANNISLGANAFVPIKTKWKDDRIFIKSYFGNDSQKIAENKFSIGTVITCKYHF